MNIYAIKDSKAKTYNTPFFQPTDVHALRAFKAEVNRAHDSNMIYLYPGEFDLVYLGEFNTISGCINSEDPKLLANGEHLKESTK